MTLEKNKLAESMEKRNKENSPTKELPIEPHSAAQTEPEKDLSIEKLSIDIVKLQKREVPEVEIKPFEEILSLNDCGRNIEP